LPDHRRSPGDWHPSGATPSKRAGLVLACAGGALVAFAGNSLLARLALAPGFIDPAAFTAVRLGSGALTLSLLAAFRRKTEASRVGRWAAPVALFAYALMFSVAYVQLGVGAGALILFGAVQVTMIAWGLWTGERLRLATWLGLGCALAGLAVLTLPGAHAPSVAAAMLMSAAGVAWGLYSVLGRGPGDPIQRTTRNFGWSVPLAVVAVAVAWPMVHTTPRGVVCAIASGSVASGLGYVLWYAALPGLSATAAAISQLVVPVLAAVGAAALLGEPVTLRVIAAGTAILGGVALALLARR
jgi:drug/metabolite transporter (DMT)-like permease